MYDPIRIRSHPGVRSDLFPRPLSSALVTDFFGGVADVDVVESHLFQDLASSSQGHHDLNSPQSDTARVNASRSMSRAGLRPLLLKHSRTVDEKRAWAGLIMVGMLVGFVLLQGKLRTTSSYNYR
jgi:GPI-anchor transamidase subunit K